ncbi:MerR family transcriptional regulator [Gordonia sp. (in: high G+C Gram-positive bacteria)]
MLTISQVASYAGVTVAAVRHYHRVGLLPEPPRDASGYRRYDAAAVVRLIRIHVLASAGVPLAQVESMLDADQASFTTAIKAIDRQLDGEIQRLQATRTRLAKLAAGDHLALPQCVVDYLARLRSLGLSEDFVAQERDAWIVVSAQVPEQINAIIAQKHRDLDDPEMVQLYRLLSTAADWSSDDPRLTEVADLLEEILNRVMAAGGVVEPDLDDRLVAFLDATMVAAAPAAAQLLTLLEQRGWTGWTRMERRSEPSPSTS